MPTSNLDWTVTCALFGYTFGFIAIVPMLTMRSLQYFVDLGKISSFSKFFLSLINLLVIYAGIIYSVSFFFGFARKFNQFTDLNGILFFVFGVLSLSIGIAIYSLFDKVLKSVFENKR